MDLYMAAWKTSQLDSLLGPVHSFSNGGEGYSDKEREVAEGNSKDLVVSRLAVLA